MVAIAICLLAVALGLTGDAEAVRATLQDTIDDGTYQADLPLDTLPGRQTRQDGPTLPAPGPLRGIIQVLAWVMLGAVALVVVVLLIMLVTGQSVGALAGPAARDKPGAVAGRVAAGAGDPRTPDRLGRAARLGETGRYQEAVHLMLLAAIDHLAAAAALRDSQTSREVAAAFDADPQRRQALRHLVRVVEHSLFGGRPVTREGYEECRHHLQALLGGSSR